MENHPDTKANESRLVHDVMRELGRHGAVYRCNSGSVKLPSGKTFRGMPKGFSDIMLILPEGRVAFVETKTRQNRPTPEQLAFIDRMRALGCRAGVAYSVPEALDICGLTPPGGIEARAGL